MTLQLETCVWSVPDSRYPTDDYPTDDYPTDDYPTDDYPTDDYPTDDLGKHENFLLTSLRWIGWRMRAGLERFRSGSRYSERPALCETRSRRVESIQTESPQILIRGTLQRSAVILYDE